jgi:carboxylesterase
MRTRYLYILLTVLSFIACNPTPEIDNATMLDGNQIFDASLDNPIKYLISASIPNPTETEKNTPVIICAHGYSASTFEWDEFREIAESKQTFFVSQVLLGGHGRDYAAFKAATWEDWQNSIKLEYQKLVDKGFRNIYLAGSSTGAPLIIEMISSGYFNSMSIKPKGIYLIDPIVVSSNKTLTMVGLLGPVLGYTTSVLESGETGKWYVYRSQESLKQLMELIDLTRKNLQKGIVLPIGTKLKIYKSKIDATADPVSAVMLYKGLKTADGKNVDIEMVNSDIHVFTRLRGRNTSSTKDIQNQQDAFTDMELRILD